MTATGDPVALVNAGALTTERTAATSALAADLLLPRTARTAAVVGYGPVGRAHVRYLRALRPDMEVRVFARTQPATAEPEVGFSDSIEAAVAGADLVMLCTSAATDVLDPRMQPTGTVVTSISTNAPGAREIPAAAVAELTSTWMHRPPSLSPPSCGQPLLRAGILARSAARCGRPGRRQRCGPDRRPCRLLPLGPAGNRGRHCRVRRLPRAAER
ncbi:MAG: hypothetical protein QM695_05175 [Micropruina sp.]